MILLNQISDIFRNDFKYINWQQINPTFPNIPISLYGIKDTEELPNKFKSKWQGNKTFRAYSPTHSDQETINAVSKTGGHLGAGLGVIELTIALHYIFDTPKDKLIWDVGHQAYPHKILTGRKQKIETLRQEDGLYGFVKRSESEYDTFGTAHSSTSISAGLGIKIAQELSLIHI